MMITTGDSAEEVAKKMKKKVEPAFISYAKTTDASSMSVEGLNTHIKSSTSSITAMGVKAKITSVAMGILKVASGALAGALLSLVISGVITFFDDLHKSQKELAEEGKQAREEIKELFDTLQSNQNTVKEISGRFAELSQSVNSLTGKNISLSDEDYAEFLDISNQLAEIFPGLSRTYLENGQAIIQLDGDVDTIVSSLDDLIDKQQELANIKIAESLPSVYASVKENVKDYKDEITSLDKEIEQINKDRELLKQTFFSDYKIPLTNDGSKIETKFNSSDYQHRLLLEEELRKRNVPFSVTQTSNDNGIDLLYNFVLSDEEYNRILTEANAQYENLLNDNQKQINQKNREISAQKDYIETEYDTLNSPIFAWLSTEPDYKTLNENMQSIMQNIIGNIDWDNINLDKDETIESFIRKNYLIPLSDVDVSPLESIYLNEDDLPVAEYINKVKEAQEYIQKQINEKYSDIEFNFDFIIDDEQDILNRVKNKFSLFNGGTSDIVQIAEQDAYFNSIPLEDLKIILDLEIAPDAKVDTIKEAVAAKKEIEEVFQEDVDLDPLNSKLDEIQSAYQTVSSAVDEYKEKGELSLNTVKSLVALGDEYVATLYDENGQLTLNTDSYNQLTIARLLDLQAAIAQNALKTIDALKSEDSAKKYLTDTTLELAGAKWQEVYANIELARTELLLKNQSGQQGEDISARLQALNQLESATRSRQALVEQAIEDAKNASSNFYGVTSGSGSSETKENIFDWADNSIKNLMRDIDNLNDKLSTVSLEDKIAIYDKLDGKNRELVNASKNAMETYEKSWNKKSSKISSKYKKRIQSNDTFTLEEFGNEKTYNAVVEAQQSYQTWQDAVDSYIDALYQKEQNQSDKTSTLLEIANIELDTLSSTDTSNMLAEEKNELINKEMAKKKEILKLSLSLAKSEAERLKIQQDYDNDKKNNKTEKYENYREIRSNRISHFQAKRQDVQNEIDIAEAMGGQGTKEQYESMNNSLDREKYWETRNRDLAKAQRDQYEYGTESWAKYNSEMQDAENNIKACTIAQIENNKAIIMLPVHELEEENKQLERSLDLLNKKKEKLEQAISYPTILIEEEIETLNKDKDTITLDYDDRIEAIEDEKESYTKVNDELQRKIDLENSLYNLEKAKRNRTQRIYKKGEGFVYEADQDAIRDAQADYDKQVYDNKVADFDKQIDELNKNKEDEIKILDKAIKKWTDYKDLLDKVSSSFDKKVAKEEFFKEFDQATLDAVMNQDTSIIPTFENQLNSLKQNIKDTEDQIYNNNQSILQYQIAAEEYGKTLLAIQQMQEILNKTLLNNTDELKANAERTDSANTYGLAWSNVKVGVATALTDGTAAQVLAKKTEEDINKERLKNLETFKKGVISIYDEISSAVLKAVNALSDLQATYNQMKSLNSAINSIPKSSPLGLLSGIGVVNSIIGTMHSGGIVGEESKNNLPEHLIALTDANLKPNETFAKLLNGEVVLNNSQMGNMFDNLNRAYTALTPLNKRENSPTNITIGDVNVYNPDNTDMIVDEIVKELPLKVIQKLHSK